MYQPQNHHVVVEPQLRVETHRGVFDDVLIRCIGEIDISSVGDVQQAVDRALGTVPSMLRLDLTGVTFIEVYGARCVIDCERRCAALGFVLTVAASPAVESVLRLLGPRARRAEAA
jgi:anti-anti-sigma factor